MEIGRKRFAPNRPVEARAADGTLRRRAPRRERARSRQLENKSALKDETWSRIEGLQPAHSKHTKRGATMSGTSIATEVDIGNVVETAAINRFLWILVGLCGTVCLLD